MTEPGKARTWAELEAWFTGENEGRLVVYSPDTNPEWDDLWLALDGDDSEIGRGMRSQSLSTADLRWLHTVLTLWLGEARR